MLHLLQGVRRNLGRGPYLTVGVAQLFNKAGDEHGITSKPAVLVSRVRVKWEMSISSVPDKYHWMPRVVRTCGMASFNTKSGEKKHERAGIGKGMLQVTQVSRRSPLTVWENQAACTNQYWCCFLCLAVGQWWGGHPECWIPLSMLRIPNWGNINIFKN